MNRREFVLGLLSGIAATAVPIPASITNAPAHIWEQLEVEIMEVLVRAFEDMVIYGTHAIKYTDKFPFVENVDLRDLWLPPTKGGLLQ